MTERTRAGPVYWEASPLSTKMPAPTMAPMPKETRESGPSARRRPCSDSAASLCSCSIVFLIQSPAMPPPSSSVETFLSGAGFRPPDEIHRDSERHNAESRQALPSGHFLSQQRALHEQRKGDVERGQDRVSPGPIRPRPIRPRAPQTEQAQDGKNVKQHRRK